MSKLGNVKFKGKSGIQYAFSVYPLQTRIRDGFSGVYIITERKHGNSGGVVHKRIRTGQSENLTETVVLAESGAANGANCICVHKEADASERQKIELDLASRRKTA
jgi:hypothetical protein